MSTNHHGLTSDAIPPPPFSEDELREQWDAQADVDEGNHWGNLGLDEQLAWAQTRAIAADRAQGASRDLPQPSAAAADRRRCFRASPTDEFQLEEADHPDGPWRPLPAPQPLPPFPVVESPVVEADPTPAAAEPLWRVMEKAWEQRQAIRAMLTTEAAKADAGGVMTTTSRPPLSPAAQAVLDAAHAAWVTKDAPSPIAAAALRAAADESETFYGMEGEGKVSAVRTDWILAIAAELEGADD